MPRVWYGPGSDTVAGSGPNRPRSESPWQSSGHDSGSEAETEREIMPTRPAKRSHRRTDTAADTHPSKRSRRDASGRMPLQRAAVRGDVKRVRELLESGAAPQDRDYAGTTALHSAALRGDIEVVKALVEHGALVDARSGADELDTPLMDAVAHGQLDVVHYLLQAGADARICNIEGKNAHDFVDEDDEDAAEIIQLLREAVVRARREGRPLIEKRSHAPPGLFPPSDAEEDASARRRLLMNMDVTTKTGRAEVPRRAAQGDLEFVGLALEQGWTPTAQALVQAAKFGHHEIVGLLLAFGMGPDTLWDGRTALHETVGRGHVATVKLLLDAGARRDWRDSDGYTYLDLLEDLPPGDPERALFDSSQPALPTSGEYQEESVSQSTEAHAQSEENEGKIDAEKPKDGRLAHEPRDMSSHDGQKFISVGTVQKSPLDTKPPTESDSEVNADRKPLKGPTSNATSSSGPSPKELSPETPPPPQQQELNAQKSSRRDPSRHVTPEYDAHSQDNSKKYASRDSREANQKNMDSKPTADRSREERHGSQKTSEPGDTLDSSHHIGPKDLPKVASGKEDPPKKLPKPATTKPPAKSLDETSRSPHSPLSPRMEVRSEPVSSKQLSIAETAQLEELARRREKDRLARETRMLANLEEARRRREMRASQPVVLPENAVSDTPSPEPSAPNEHHQTVSVANLPLVLRRLAYTGQSQPVEPLLVYDWSDTEWILDVQAALALGRPKLNSEYPQWKRQVVADTHKLLIWNLVRPWMSAGSEDPHEKDRFMALRMSWLRLEDVRPLFGNQTPRMIAIRLGEPLSTVVEPSPMTLPRVDLPFRLAMKLQAQQLQYKW